MAQVGTAAASRAGAVPWAGEGLSLPQSWVFCFFLQGSQGLWVGVQVSAGSIFQVVQID